MAVPREWGFCFAGNEGAFCEALDVAIESQPVGRPFTYVEIGIGHGSCLKAVAEWLAQHEGVEWEIHGCDLPGYSGHATRAEEMGPHFSKMRLWLCGAEAFFQTFSKPADFIFIDGCHGKACVVADFLGAARILRNGGVICFHDTDAACQGAHHQPHCGTGIAARAAVEELGLLDGRRAGWRKLMETPGNFPDAHGCLFVQRVMP